MHSSARNAGLEPLAEVEAGVPQVAARAAAGSGDRSTRDGCRPTAALPGREVDPCASSNRTGRRARRCRRSRGAAPTARARRRRPSLPNPGCPSRRRARCHRIGWDRGRCCVTAPFGRCSAARSRSHLAEKSVDVVEVRGGVDVDLPVAGPPGALARGQSVGISHALPRKLHSATRWSRLIRSSEHANAPIRREVGVHDDAGDRRPASSGPAWPSTRTYWKPLVLWRGSKTSPPSPADTTTSIWKGVEAARPVFEVRQSRCATG